MPILSLDKHSAVDKMHIKIYAN